MLMFHPLKATKREDGSVELFLVKCQSKHPTRSVTHDLFKVARVWYCAPSSEYFEHNTCRKTHVTLTGLFVILCHPVKWQRTALELSSASITSKQL